MNAQAGALGVLASLREIFLLHLGSGVFARDSSAIREALLEQPRLAPELKKAFGGLIIAKDSFTRETGEQVLANGEADAVAYGRLFIANPDLPRRFALNAPLNEPVPETFYAAGSRGYTDYPFLDLEEQAA